ncbi:cyclic-phosphate processing receiver domain-containing protein [Micromonospora musae]|uniref:cyclic-phosphate processing receiver domain-containing protein n=1 Tax=Micromonospora musae TaxID=1894970 RepID=UPI0033CFFAC2
MGDGLSGCPDGNQVAARDAGEKNGVVVVAGRRIVLIDDLRSFVEDSRAVQVARTSAAGVEVLERQRGQRVDELWLDHDLGGDDNIWPVVELLERAAFEERPFDIGVVYIHSANPAGAARVLQALRRWGYHARPATGSSQVGYLEQNE